MGCCGSKACSKEAAKGKEVAYYDADSPENTEATATTAAFRCRCLSVCRLQHMLRCRLCWRRVCVSGVCVRACARVRARARVRTGHRHRHVPTCPRAHVHARAFTIAPCNGAADVHTPCTKGYSLP